MRVRAHCAALFRPLTQGPDSRSPAVCESGKVEAKIHRRVNRAVLRGRALPAHNFAAAFVRAVPCRVDVDRKIDLPPEITLLETGREFD